MLELIVYLIRMMKINQLDLKRLCFYSDADILVNGTITVAGNHPRDRQNKPVILKTNALVISCITKINNELI